jgi:hypothetical protein
VSTLSLELKRRPTDEEIREICEAAEEAARKFLLAKIRVDEITDLDVTVEAVGDKPLTLNVGVALELAAGGSDLDALVDQATDNAFGAAEAKAKELDLCEIIPI